MKIIGKNADIDNNIRERERESNASFNFWFISLWFGKIRQIN